MTSTIVISPAGILDAVGALASSLAADVAENEAVRSRWLAEVLSGKLFGLASAELGIVSPADFKTSVRLNADGSLVLNGRKYYSTGSLFADIVEVTAVDADGRHVSLVVPADREGVTLVDDFDGMGQRATASGTTTFDGVRVEPV